MSESSNTLRYAARAKRIKTKPVVVMVSLIFYNKIISTFFLQVCFYLSKHMVSHKYLEFNIDIIIFNFSFLP